MDNNNPEIDPWANMGNIGSRSGEISVDNIERAEQWNQAMENPPAFNGETQSTATESPAEAPLQPTAEDEKRDETIADASAIINYGLNAAAREKGVEIVIQTINNFVPNGRDDTIKQLFNDLGISTREETANVIDESRAIRPSENTFHTENINAPTTLNRSESGALNAIKEVKELVAEVQTAPEYAELRADAFKNGKGIFEYAVSKYGARDLTVLFSELSMQKKATEKESQTLEPEAEAEEDKKGKNQSESQSSILNPFPETDATESKGSTL